MTDTPGKTIYDLALHETMEVGKHYDDHMYATRVAGGFLYREGKNPDNHLEGSSSERYS